MSLLFTWRTSLCNKDTKERNRISSGVFLLAGYSVLFCLAETNFSGFLSAEMQMHQGKNPKLFLLQPTRQRQDRQISKQRDKSTQNQNEVMFTGWGHAREDSTVSARGDGLWPLVLGAGLSSFGAIPWYFKQDIVICVLQSWGLLFVPLLGWL